MGISVYLSVVDTSIVPHAYQIIAGFLSVVIIKLTPDEESLAIDSVLQKISYINTLHSIL